MKKGFTLIELISVIVIIALLAMVTVPMIMGTLNNSKEKMFVTNVKELVSIAEQDVTENSRSCKSDDDTSCVYELTYTKGKSVFMFNNKEVNFSGTITKGTGKVIIDNNGKVKTVNIWNDDLKKCAVFLDDSVVINEKVTNKRECVS